MLNTYETSSGLVVSTIIVEACRRSPTGATFRALSRTAPASSSKNVSSIEVPIEEFLLICSTSDLSNKMVTTVEASLAGSWNVPCVREIEKSSGLLLELVEYSITLENTSEDLLTGSLKVRLRISMLMSSENSRSCAPLVSAV